MTNLEQLQKYFSIQSKAVELYLSQVALQPSDKAIHRLRLATRRVRALLWVIKHCTSDVSFKELNHDLRKLGKKLGHVRELDVAVRDAGNYGIDASKLKKQRAAAKQKIQILANSKNQKNILRQLLTAKKMTRTIKNLSFICAQDDLKAVLNQQLEQFLSGKTKSHKLRIVLKKTRYALEAMGRPVEQIKPLQDILGDAHDLVALQAFVGKNSKIKTKQQTLNKNAARLVRPALRSAIIHLGGTAK